MLPLEFPGAGTLLPKAGIILNVVTTKTVHRHVAFGMNTYTAFTGCRLLRGVRGARNEAGQWACPGEGRSCVPVREGSPFASCVPLTRCVWLRQNTLHLQLPMMQVM
jgi:hypothetical protein